jgi:hypothetical protein
MGDYSMKRGGKEVGPASTYAKPHDMKGRSVSINDAGIQGKMPTRKNWTPLAGVAIGNNDEVKTSGIKMRGTGAATKGTMSRGPMA